MAQRNTGNRLDKVGAHPDVARADIVFVHGLDGDPQSTWTSAGGFWPAWLAEDLGDVRVWSLGYPAASSGWRGHGAHIITSAQSLFPRLKQAGLGQRPLVLVAHSMGGLVAKQLLRHADDSNDPLAEEFVRNARGVAFLATPHRGSGVATTAGRLARLVPFRKQPTIDSLVANSPELMELNRWYKNRCTAREFATLAYREDVKTNGVWVVDPASADPGISDVEVVPVPRNHQQICKPSDRDDEVYTGVLAFIRECLAVTPQTTSPVSSLPVSVHPDINATSLAPALPPATKLYGRDAEAAALVGAMLDQDGRPIAVLGQAGIGKSALTRHMLHAAPVAERYGARRWFVRLETAPDTRAIWTSILQALGEQIGPRPDAQALALLAADPALLVLDNGETPLEGDAEGADEAFAQLAAVRGLALVVSIRGAATPFGPDWRRVPEALAPLALEAAREQFLSIAGVALAQDPDLDALLTEADGLPLAVSLLAHLAQGAGQLRGLLGDYRAKKLALDLGAGKDRNLTASIRLSFDSPKLTDTDRRLFAIMGRLPAGVIDEDAATLVEGGSAAARALCRIGIAYPAGPRTLMLAPIRQLAEGIALVADDERRMVEHYLGLARTEGIKAGAEGGAQAIARLTPEFVNLTSLTDLAVHPDADPALVSVTIDATIGLAELMRFTGLGVTSPLQAIADAAGRSDNVLGEANSVFGLGNIALSRSDHAAAREGYERALPLYQQVGNVLGEANCIKNLGNIALARSDHVGARVEFERALALYGQIDDVLGGANCIKSLGNIALARSDHEAARSEYERALALYQLVGDVLGEASCIRNLGDIALRRSDNETARNQYELALPLFQQVGSVLGEANCIRSLGDIALRSSDHAAARKQFECALPLYQQVGSVLGEANCIQSLGNIAFGLLDVASAREAFERALPLYRQVGSVLGEANCIKSLGDIALADSDHASARGLWQQALAFFAQISEPYSIGMVHRRLAHIAAGEERTGHIAAARAAWLGIDRPDLVAKLDQEFGEG